MESDNRSDQEIEAAPQSGSGDADTLPFGTGLVLPQIGGPETVRSALSGHSEDPPQCARHAVWDRHMIRFNSINPKARGRLNRELTQITEDPPEGCKVKRMGDHLFEWEATITGPKHTPYEGGIFKLRLYFPLSYPFTPPEVCFETKIYHCNVGADGKLYLDSLGKNWSPVLTVANILLSISSILVHPNLEYPVEENIAKLYKLHRKLHDNNARVWTILYAKADDAPTT